jgi:vacuolar-type H+-ATPase subunit H
MKKLLLVSCLLIALFNQIQAQSAMKNLLNSVKDKIQKAKDDAATKLKTQATDQATQIAGQATDKATQLVGQATDQASNSMNDIVVVAQKKLSSISLGTAVPTATKTSDEKNVAPVADNAPAPSNAPNILQPDLIETAMQKDYPLFYKSYVYLEQNDPAIKNIIFGYKEGHKNICTSYPKKGVIFFDLYYFEDDKLKEERAIFDLFQMIGYLHFGVEFPNVKDPVKSNAFTFEYALKATMDFAEKNGCGPLRHATNVIKKRSTTPEANYNPKDPAAKIVSEGAVYKECLEYLNTKCKG